MSKETMHEYVGRKLEEHGLPPVKALENGINVAVVFREKLPETICITPNIYRVIDGDKHDWRWGDYDDYPDERVIVGLLAKGHLAKQDKTGFVI